jgi:hypothetical protein
MCLVRITSCDCGQSSREIQICNDGKRQGMIHFRDSTPIDSEYRVEIDVDDIHADTYAIKVYQVMEQQHIQTAHCNQCDSIADAEYDYLSGSDLSDPEFQRGNVISKDACPVTTTLGAVNGNFSTNTNQQPQLQSCCRVTVTACRRCQFQCGHGPLQLCANELGHIHISEGEYKKVEEGKILVKTYTERGNWLLIYDLLAIDQTLHDYCWGCRHG